MARFDIYRNQGGNGYLLDVQSDLLSGLNTRMIVPLLPSDASLQPAQRLNPLFEVEGNRVIMATQFMAAVPASELGAPIASLEQQQFEITGALDMLFHGF